MSDPFNPVIILLSEIPEWGALVAQGTPNIRTYPYMVLGPALAFFIAIVGLNAFGEGLRRIFNRWPFSTAFLLKKQMLVIVAAFVGVSIVIFQATNANVSYQQVADSFEIQSATYRYEELKIYNNIAYNNEGVGLHLFKTNHLIRNIQIVNNTFYDNGLGWGGGIFINNSRVDDILIRNNILSQNLTFQIAAAEGVSMDNLTIDHNLIDGYRGADGEIYGSDYVQGDPLFVNPAGLDFHLQHGSPAIDQGSPIDAPATDFDGSPRPSMTGGYDIGAFEHPYGFNMAADLPAQAIQAGESAVYTLQVSAVGEFDTPVALAHSPAPSGLLLSLEPATVAPGNAATLMLSDLHTGTLLPGLAHTISITGVGDGLVVNETVHLIVGGVRFYLPIIIGE